MNIGVKMAKDTDEKQLSISAVKKKFENDINTYYDSPVMVDAEKTALEKILTGIFSFDYECVTGDSIVQDAINGRIYLMKDIIFNNIPLKVISHKGKSDNSFGGSKSDYTIGGINNWIDKGLLETVIITTRAGINTKVALRHAYLTDKGWRTVKELKVGDKIVRPFRYGFSTANDGKMDKNNLKFLGYYLSEGCGNADNCPRITVFENEVLYDLEKIVGSKRYKCSDGGNGNYSIVGAVQSRDWNGQYTDTNIFRNMLKYFDLWGKLAHEKFIPDTVMLLRKNYVKYLLSRMFIGDG